MKILIVSRSFYPTQSPRAFRTTELAFELARQGHEVKLYIAQKGDYTTFMKQYKLDIQVIPNLFFHDLKFSKNRLVSYFDNLLRRGLGKLVNYPDIELMFRIPKALKKESSYDMMISIAVPHSIHWGCERSVAKNPLLAKCWVADCGDPFMGNSVGTRMWYMAVLEKKFCRRCSYISIPVEAALSAYYPEFHHKIRIIPQGFKFPLMIENKNVSNPIITFGYAGIFYKGNREPDLLLEFLTTLKVDFRFIIYAPNIQSYKPLLYYKERLADKLVLENPIPRVQLIDVLKKMDFVVNFQNRSHIQSPSKLIDYAIVGRPILNIEYGKLDEIVIRQFFNRDYSSRFILPNLDNYRIENVVLQFLNCIK